MYFPIYKRTFFFILRWSPLKTFVRVESQVLIYLFYDLKGEVKEGQPIDPWDGRSGEDRAKIATESSASKISTVTPRHS